MMTDIEKQPELLAHYTTAEAAINIIKSQEFWLRKAKYMNDHSEVTHGADLLRELMKDPQLRDSFPKPQLLDELQNEYYTITYLACLTKYDRGSQYIWKEFGSNQGVALVLKNNFGKYLQKFNYANDCKKIKKRFKKLNIRFISSDNSHKATSRLDKVRKF